MAVEAPREPTGFDLMIEEINKYFDKSITDDQSEKIEFGVKLIADGGGIFVVLYSLIYSLNYCCTCKCYKSYLLER